MKSFHSQINTNNWDVPVSTLGKSSSIVRNSEQRVKRKERKKSLFCHKWLFVRRKLVFLYQPFSRTHDVMCCEEVVSPTLPRDVFMFLLFPLITFPWNFLSSNIRIFCNCNSVPIYLFNWEQTFALRENNVNRNILESLCCGSMFPQCGKLYLSMPRWIPSYKHMKFYSTNERRKNHLLFTMSSFQILINKNEFCTSLPTIKKYPGTAMLQYFRV